MKCFTHPDTDAVAICHACSRGLCSECVVDVGKVSACRDRCEEDVASLNRLLDRDMRSLKDVGSIYRSSALFAIYFGVILILLSCFPLYLGVRTGETGMVVTGLVLLVLALPFVGHGVFQYRRGSRLRKT